MLGSLVAFGLGTGGGGPPPVVYDPSASNLSVWLRADDVTGNGATLSWPGRLSTGTSAGNGYEHSTPYLDEVVTSATTIDTRPTIEWPTSASYPLLETAATTRGDILGQGEGTGASYTVAAVVQLLASNSNGLSGGKTNFSNPMLLGDAGSYVRIGTIHSTASIGVVHLDGVAGPTSGGITPVAWPGGFGAWGLVWFVFDYTSGTTGTLSVRINGVDVASETIRVSRGSLGVDTNGTMGASGGGSEVGAFRLAEFLVYPGQAFTSGQLAAKETYFAARYPSLGL